MSHLFRQPPDLIQHLHDLLRQIPTGRVATCGSLARALGNVIASRWIGMHLRRHEHECDCPCHRVVLSDGKLGGYVGGNLSEKRRRLERDGIAISDECIDLSVYEFDDFETTKPLEKLPRQQHRLLEKLEIESLGRPIEVVAGVDVSYVNEYEGVAAYALIDAQTTELVWSTTLRRPVRFPYITSYLAYRELPILLELLDAVRCQHRLGDLLLVDGSGIMHPRGAGIASQLGIVADLATVGVTKKHLFGRVDIENLQPGERRLVCDGEKPIGVALRRRSQSKRPLFISPGHRTTVEESAECVASLISRHSLPEPIYWADRLSRSSGERDIR